MAIMRVSIESQQIAIPPLCFIFLSLIILSLKNSGFTPVEPRFGNYNHKTRSLSAPSRHQPLALRACRNSQPQLLVIPAQAGMTNRTGSTGQPIPLLSGDFIVKRGLRQTACGLLVFGISSVGVRYCSFSILCELVQTVSLNGTHRPIMQEGSYQPVDPGNRSSPLHYTEL
jgi:hypothetical protein